MRCAALLCRKRFFQMLLLKAGQRTEIHKRTVLRFKRVVQLLGPAERGACLRGKRAAKRGGAANFLSLRFGKRCHCIKPEVLRGLAVKTKIAGHRNEG